MTDQEFAEMIAIVGMAAETNRLVTALGVDVDEAFLVGPAGSSDASKLDGQRKVAVRRVELTGKRRDQEGHKQNKGF